MKHKISAILYLLLLWQIVSGMMHNNLVMPGVVPVVKRMGIMLGQADFYLALLLTMSHVLISILIAFLVALVLSYLSYRYSSVEEIASPIIAIFQAIPNISYIILALVWTGSLQTVFLVLFLVLFPMLYTNLLEGFKGIDSDLKDVIWLYHPPLDYKIMHVYLPLISHSVIAGLKNALNLGIKVGVMAEILAASETGVGRAMNYCRTNFDMIGLFAWTIYLVILIMLIDALMKKTVYKNA